MSCKFAIMFVAWLYLLLHVGLDLSLETLKGLQRAGLVLAAEGHGLGNNTCPLLKA